MVKHTSDCAALKSLISLWISGFILFFKLLNSRVRTIHTILHATYIANVV